MMTFQAVEDEREADNEEEEEEDEEYDSGGSGVALTPPESPGNETLYFFSVKITANQNLGAGRRQLQKKRSVADGMIDPERDLYAIPSQDGGEIYFLSLVDILTHYGQCSLILDVSTSSKLHFLCSIIYRKYV